MLNIRKLSKMLSSCVMVIPKVTVVRGREDLILPYNVPTMRRNMEVRARFTYANKGIVC